jgi:hypothetical protein
MHLSSEVKDLCLSSTWNYIRYAIGEEIEDYFLDPINAIDNATYQRIAISACHAIGKTFTIARIMKALMDKHIGIKLISTAPTFRQVNDLLWKEFHTAHKKTHPYFLRKGSRLNDTSYWIDSETYARGFSPQKSVKSETGQGTDSVFQGYHAQNMVVVIFDEATGISPSLWIQAEGLLTSGKRVLFLAIANPTTRNCDFYECFEKPSWKKFEITCFDTPNLKAAGLHCVEDIQKEADLVEELRIKDPELALERLASYPCPKPHLINVRWVIEKAGEWGVDHPLFLGKVIGKFPGEDSKSLITKELIEESQAREVEEDIHEQEIAYIGLDVAREGEDSSVWTSMIGRYQDKMVKVNKHDTNEVVGGTINFIEDLKERWPNVKEIRLAVDGGYGHGVIDNLREKQGEEENERVFSALNGVDILEINFGAQDWVIYHFGWIDEFTRKQREKEREVQEDRQNYANYKAKMFDMLRRDIRADIVLKKFPVYAKQIPTILKLPDGKGRLKIEAKTDYKQRTGKTSPDEADSLALCNFARFFAVKQKNNVFEAFTS